MSSASFCPICGEITSDGCVDDDGNVSYSPCVCETGIDSNNRIRDWGKATAYLAQDARAQQRREILEEAIDAVWALESSGEAGHNTWWEGQRDAAQAIRTLIGTSADAGTEAQ